MNGMAEVREGRARKEQKKQGKKTKRTKRETQLKAKGKDMKKILGPRIQTIFLICAITKHITCIKTKNVYEKQAQIK